MFVHLNNHSDYSLRHSTSTITSMVSRVAELGQPAVALTDEGNLFGAVDFFTTCKQYGVSPIMGCELIVTSPNRFSKTHTKDSNAVIFLAQNSTGFQNLKELSSIAYLEGFYYVPRIDMETIATYNKDLICIVPQHGSRMGRSLELAQTNQAQHEINIFKEIFNDRLYLEIQNHGLSIESQINQKIVSLGKQNNITIVASNACYYPTREDALVHDMILRNEKHQYKTFANDQFYIKNEEELQLFFKEYPYALDNTVEVANRCSFEMEFIGPQLPHFHIPDEFESQAAYLRHLTMEGLIKRYNNITDEIKHRAEFELHTIIDMNYSGYFLIVWDIIAFANRSDIPVGLGRGSAAGSIVAYALGITGIDPLRYGLLFERFLNPERISMPDIDTDFCVEQRPRIIRYIKEKYGEDNVGQIITFSTLKLRGALKEAARSLEFTPEESNEISKLIPVEIEQMDKEKRNINTAIKLKPELKKYSSERHTQLFKLTDKLYGLLRHASLHAAGVVIGADRLINYVPLYRDPNTKSTATQYSMNYLEDCGLAKMDILGLRTVSTIQHAEKLIQKEEPNFSIEHTAQDDLKVYRMLSKGDSNAVFQFEGEGMQNALRKVKPSRIEDLIALNALYRPGPLQFIDTYAAVKHSTQSPEYHLDILKPILEETYGIIIYQEQVMEIARVVGGFTLAAADILRRAMGKKKKSEMDAMFAKFVEGAIKNGIARKKAEDIFELLKPFADYGFNKSHAAAYAILAYRTAFLKCHYPTHFMVAMLNGICNKPEDLSKELKTTKNMGITILPPDVNHSEYEFSIENHAIRYGLNAIKNISNDIKHHIPKERHANGVYTSVINVIERLPDHSGIKTLLEAGIPAGVFTSIHDNRPLLFANMEALKEEGRIRIDARKQHQSLLFTDDASYDNPDNTIGISLPNLPVDEQHIIQLERESLGAFLTKTPLDSVSQHWKETTTCNLNTPQKYMNNSFARNSNATQYTSKSSTHYLVAYIDPIKEMLDRNKRTFMGILHDYNGEMRFIYSIHLDDPIRISKNKPYGFIGNISYKEDRGYTFYVKQITDVHSITTKKQNDVSAPPPVYQEIKKTLFIQIDHTTTQDQLQDLKDFMMGYFGNTRILIQIPHHADTDISYTIALPFGFTVDASNTTFIEHLRQHPIITNVWI